MHDDDNDRLVPEPFSDGELTRIYRETAADAEGDGDRLTVLLAPYAGGRVPRQRGPGDRR
jgi:hypothetical protein